MLQYNHEHDNTQTPIGVEEYEHFMVVMGWGSGRQMPHITMIINREVVKGGGVVCILRKGAE